MAYLWLKWLHILSATVLFGTGIGIAFFKWYSDRHEDPHLQAGVLRIVVIADWCFTTPAVIIQPVTGLWLAHLAGIPLNSTWLIWAWILYSIGGACWLPVLWLQLRMRSLAEVAAATGEPLPALYHRYRKIWFALGMAAFLALLAIFYLMVFKPN
jgi:uncharacterized membrane protein